MTKVGGYIVTPIVVGGMALMKSILVDHHMPESPQVWVDVLTNVASFLTSKLVTELVIEAPLKKDKKTADGFIVQEISLIVEPLIHGSLNGFVKHFFIDTNSIRLLNIKNLAQGRVLPVQHYSFFTGFKEGVVYNMLGTHIAEPIANLF